MFPKRVIELVLRPSQHLRQRWERVGSLADWASFSMTASYCSVTSKMLLIWFWLIMPQTWSLRLFMTSSSYQFLLAQILRRSFQQSSPMASRRALRFSILSPQACFSKNLIKLTLNSCASRSKALRSTSEGRIFSYLPSTLLKSSRQRFSIRFDSERQTRSQLFSISGSPPLLMESQKCWQSETNMAGEHGLPLKVFFLIPMNTLMRSSRINYKNRGRISLSLHCDMFCNLRSSSTGRMSMKQSRSLKKEVSSLRMPFFRTAISLVPF